MSIIETTAESDARDRVAEWYDEDRAHMGIVASHTKVMSLNPDALEAWNSLALAIKTALGKRRYELATLAAALGARSQHCRLAHGAVTLSLIDEAQLVRIARDYHDADLDPAEVAMMEFAERVSRDSSAMTDADSLALRAVGFTDLEIVNIALAAAARNYYSRAIQALAVDVDPSPLNEPLRTALVEGL